MKNFKRKMLCMLAACSLLMLTGACNIDSWTIALGRGFGGGVGLQFDNGNEVVVPLLHF